MRRFVVWMYAPDTPHWSMPTESRERIRAALPDDWALDFVDIALEATGDGVRVTPPEVLTAVAEAEVYCGWGIRRDVFQAAEKLRWFHSGAAGVGNSLFDEMVESDVLFTNSAGMYADALADHALAGMLYFTRGFDLAVRAQRERRWAQSELNRPDSPLHAGGPHAEGIGTEGVGTERIGTERREAGGLEAGGPRGELAGSMLGIIGYGGIGRALGIRAHALGVEVQAIRRTPGALPPELSRIEGPEYLPKLLETSDFVMLSAPETAETRQLLGAAELARMRPGAVLINLARGSLVDEDALLQALMERRLRGALLDVFEREPLPADHPLWSLDNVLVTPHVGGTSARFWERETDLIVGNIARYLAGEALENRVDKERGY